MSDARFKSTQHSKPKTQNLVEVCAALIFHHGKLLIAQRHADAHLGGLWEFPGGKREAGETFEQCLVREIREELGVEISVGELFEEIAHDYPEKSVHLRFFKCRWRDNEPQAIGCSAFVWVTPPGLSHYAFPAADARILQMLSTTPDLWD
jgi:8-oxo-dGTP diphosphatase